MTGKILPIMDFDLKFANEQKQIDLFATFEYKKNGNTYVIFKHHDSDTLMYGSSYFKDSSLVIIDIKNKEEELFKEFISNYLNDSLTDYKILPIDKITKVEIIGENSLEIDKDIITKLNDKAIPKPIVTIKEEIKPNKKNKLPLIIIFIVLIASILLYFLLKKEDITIKYLCTRQTTNKDNVNLTDNLEIEFDKKEVIINSSNTIYYKFNTATSYFEFKNKNEYYNYLSESSTYKFDDEKITLIEFKKVESRNFPNNISEVISYYHLDGYTCKEVSND